MSDDTHDRDATDAIVRLSALVARLALVPRTGTFGTAASILVDGLALALDEIAVLPTELRVDAAEQACERLCSMWTSAVARDEPRAPESEGVEIADVVEKRRVLRRPSPVENLLEHKAAQKARILRALTACGWNRLQAARMCKIPRRTFYRRMKEYGIQE